MVTLSHHIHAFFFLLCFIMKSVPNLFFSALYSSVKHGYPALLSFVFSLMLGPSPLMGQIAGFYTLLF